MYNPIKKSTLGALFYGIILKVKKEFRLLQLLLKFVERAF